MTREKPTIRKWCRNPIEVVTLGSAGGCVLEDVAPRDRFFGMYLA
jgi:hypothetical protein